MTQELIRKRTILPEEARTLAARPSRHRFALAAILVLSAFLNLYNLAGEGYANDYYAAGVKNMLTSWHNFFFASFDAGFVSVDKPPLGLWIQAASAWLFGFHGWALLLPQAIAGVLSVALIYHLVRRPFGSVAGLIAALALALTPIVVATSRNNTADMLVVLTVLVAAWALVRATETGRLRWLLLCAVIVGLGFNIKMLEAFLVLPAFYLLYLVAAPLTLRRRFVHIGIATLMLLVVSLSWVVVVDLTPTDQRPYVGSSTDNTVTNLILHYNGLDRLWGISFRAGEAMPAGKLGGPGLGTKQNGEPGPFRLLNHQYAGQIGWLLPLAVVGLLAAGWQRRLRLPLDRRHQALVLWGTWFLTAAAYFSVAGGQHRYYTVMLTPAVAALVGAGLMALWSDYRSSGPEGWFLPLALVLMAVLHVRMLAGYEEWSSRLTPMIVGLCLTAAAVLVVLRLKPKPKVGAYAAVATAVGVLALLIAPTVWASYQVFQGPRGPLPAAGPPPSQVLADRFGGVNAQGAGGINPPSDGQTPSGVSNLGVSPVGASGNAADPALIDYLQTNQGNAEYLVAATSTSSTAPIILSTDEPVISLGGYSGIDPVFTTKQLTDLVNKGAVRFFLIPDSKRSGDGASSQQSGQQSASPQDRSARWVQHNCERVPRKLWQSSSFPDQGEEGPGTMRPQALYDCGTGRR